MIENITMLKNWYTLTKPKLRFFIVQFITNLIGDLTLMAAAVPAANIIVSLNDGNYNDSYLWLWIGFIILIIRQIGWHINYQNQQKMIEDSYTRLQDRIYDKIISAKDVEFKENSKGKLLPVINNDLYTVSALPTLLMRKLTRFIRTIMTIIVIFMVNKYIGLVLLVIIFINFFILNYLNTILAKIIRDRTNKQAAIFEKFSDIIDTREVITKYNASKKVKKNYQKRVNGYVHDIKKEDFFWQSIKDNGFFSYYQLIIVFITMALIFLVSEGQITLTIYLIVVPYIKELFVQSREFINVTSDIKNADVGTLRINTILNFSEKELINFGKNANDDIDGNIEFNGVSYKNSDQASPYYGEVKDLNFKISQGNMTLIKGLKQSGKRQIFYLLARAIKPDDGHILMDGINIYDYTEKVYKSNLNFVTYKPNFIEGSIMKNLRLIEPNKNEIKNLCKKLGLHDFIMKLPKKYDTNINSNKDIIPNEKLFLLSLARCLLTKSEIILIYEFPSSLSTEEIKNINIALNDLTAGETVIIFSATDKCEVICDRVIDVKRGSITEHKVNPIAE